MKTSNQCRITGPSGVMSLYIIVLDCMIYYWLKRSSFKLFFTPIDHLKLHPTSLEL